MTLAAALLCAGACGERGAPAEERASARAASSAPSAGARAGGRGGAPVTATFAAPPVDAIAVAARQAGCAAGGGAAIAVSPAAPVRGHALRILVTTHAREGALAVVVDGAMPPASLPVEERLGPPRSAFASIASAPEGKLRVIALRAGEPVGCLEVAVAAEARVDARARGSRPWDVARAWDAHAEDLYSAWIEKLFDVKEEEPLSVAALHELTSDAKRNFLFDHLGLGEDSLPPAGMKLDPDCADLPYVLRGYFAFKLGLPFAYSSCTRGSRAQAPRCLRMHTVSEPMDDPPRERARRFQQFARVTLADTVHSGTGRTLASDDFTDYYPVRLSRETLRPGAIYADPYGHILVVARRVPQTADRAGALFAVDGQPDGTVAKKRYWQGNFLFSTAEPSMGSPGFKRFRPVVVRAGETVTLTNAEIAADPSYGDLDLEQAGLTPRAFYDKMDDVLSPEPLDPERALAELVRALAEQATARVTSVENGEKYFRAGGGRIDMPDGAAIFETTGEWEDFSTPSRDLRLLIAVDVVIGFPALVGRRPERFRMPAGRPPSEVVAALERSLATQTRAARLTYTKTDGAAQELTIADVIARRDRLEMAYNPNDCPELRWGAADGDPEAATCRRRAPADQRRKMEKVRAWFRDRQRPARGG